MDSRFILFSLFLVIFLIVGVLAKNSIFSLPSVPNIETPENNTVQNMATSTEIQVSVSNKKQITIGSTTVWVDVANTAEERSKGLSGRETLSLGEGMLFVFPEPGLYGFWMPDMNFAIDIIWIDKDGKIQGAIENATPLSPLLAPVNYYPPVPIQYALEVPAGFYKGYNISTGTIATIPW